MLRTQILRYVTIISISLAIAALSVFTAAVSAFTPLSDNFQDAGNTIAFIISLIISIGLLVPFAIYRMLAAKKNKKWAVAEGVLHALIMKYPNKNIDKEDVLADLKAAANITGTNPIEALDALLKSRYKINASLITKAMIKEAKKLIQDSVAKIAGLHGVALDRERATLERRRNELKVMEMQRKQYEKIVYKSYNSQVYSFLFPYILSILIGAFVILGHNGGWFTLQIGMFTNGLTFPDNFTIQWFYALHFGIIFTSAVCNFFIPYKILT